MPTLSTRQALSWALVLLAALPGAWYGFAFGMRLSGALLGLVLALNGAAMCSVLASALVERLPGLRPQGR